MVMVHIFILFFSIFALFFTSCSTSSAGINFQEDTFYYKSLQYTLKNDIVKNGEVLVMFSATYLNAVDENIKDHENELFLVGVFITNSSIKNDKFFLKEYTITLNGLKPEVMYAYNNNSSSNKIYDKIPLYNPWAKYYIVKFNKNKIDKIISYRLSNRKKYKNFDYKKINLKLFKNQNEFTSVTFQREI